MRFAGGGGGRSEGKRRASHLASPLRLPLLLGRLCCCRLAAAAQHVKAPEQTSPRSAGWLCSPSPSPKHQSSSNHIIYLRTVGANTMNVGRRVGASPRTPLASFSPVSDSVCGLP